MSLRIPFKRAGAKLILSIASLLFAANGAEAQQPADYPGASRPPGHDPAIPAAPLHSTAQLRSAEHQARFAI